MPGANALTTLSGPYAPAQAPAMSLATARQERESLWSRRRQRLAAAEEAKLAEERRKMPLSTAEITAFLRDSPMGRGVLDQAVRTGVRPPRQRPPPGFVDGPQKPRRRVAKPPAPAPPYRRFPRHNPALGGQRIMQDAYSSANAAVREQAQRYAELGIMPGPAFWVPDDPQAEDRGAWRPLPRVFADATDEIDRISVEAYRVRQDVLREQRAIDKKRAEADDALREARQRARAQVVEMEAAASRHAASQAFMAATAARKLVRAARSRLDGRRAEAASVEAAAAPEEAPPVEDTPDAASVSTEDTPDDVQDAAPAPAVEVGPTLDVVVSSRSLRVSARYAAAGADSHTGSDIDSSAPDRHGRASAVLLAAVDQDTGATCELAVSTEELAPFGVKPGAAIEAVLDTLAPRLVAYGAGKHLLLDVNVDDVLFERFLAVRLAAQREED